MVLEIGVELPTGGRRVSDWGFGGGTDQWTRQEVAKSECGLQGSGLSCESRCGVRGRTHGSAAQGPRAPFLALTDQLASGNVGAQA